MDYTPGRDDQRREGDFQPIFNRPMSQGTRCQQLAMYVVYESPLQMLADSPSNYRREPESLAFLAAVPTVWDETRVLSATVGEHILVARRTGTGLVRRGDDELGGARSRRGPLVPRRAGASTPTSTATARTPIAPAWTTRARRAPCRRAIGCRFTSRRAAGWVARIRAK